MAHNMRVRAMALAASAAALTLVVAGCASSGTPGATESPTDSGVLTLYGAEVPYNEELAAMLPEDVTEKGTLVFTTDGAAPPRSFVDENGDLAGVIPDLLTAIGATLGVEIDLQKNSFDAEVPGVESGRFDSTTGTGDFPTRREVLDMVDYYKAGLPLPRRCGQPRGCR